jgi:SAM-dependent methyltransferase
MATWDKYRDAHAWSESAYAMPDAYLAHRAALIRSLGVPLMPGDTIVDLACGDAGLAAHLPAQRYLGVDASHAMVESARARGVDMVEADLNEYAPDSKVDAVTLFRALYYVSDRPSFFARVEERARKKLVFDVNPRQYPIATICDELRDAGFRRIETRPFLVPQTRSLPNVAVRVLTRLETTPAAPLLLRRRFTVVVAAMP